MDKDALGHVDVHELLADLLLGLGGARKAFVHGGAAGASRGGGGGVVDLGTALDGLHD